MPKLRDLLALLAVTVLAGTLSMSAVSADDGDEPSLSLAEDGTVSRTSSFSVEKPLVTRGDLVNIIVKLDLEPLAAFRGGVAGLESTSAEGRKLDAASASSRAYLTYVDGRLADFERAAKAAAPSATVLYRYNVVLGGVALRVPQADVAAIASLPDVVAVYADRLEQVDTENSPGFIGAPAVWDQLGGQGSAAEGLIVGVLDTGIWPEHPSFADPDPAGVAYPEPPNSWRGSTCDFSGGDNPGDAFECNNKLIGAYRFMEGYDAGEDLLPGEFTSARDDDGHGTHTTSTAAGNGGVVASIFGIERGTISGVAPRAHVVMYKVCGEEGCAASDTTAAVQQAILDGVDVINFSISGGNDPFGDSTEMAFLDAYEAGIFVAASAGNDGPGADTTNHRSGWVTTVAASSHDRAFVGSLAVTLSSGETYMVEGASVTEGITDDASIVSAAEFGDPLCEQPFAEDSVAGQIVLCQRGVNARIDKGYNVLQGGALGMLLYNVVPAQDIETDNHWLPTIHATWEAAQPLLAFIAGQESVTATTEGGVATEGQGDVIAAFSSRGGPGQSGGISKPDLTAPGVEILAGASPAPSSITNGRPGELFQAIAGTSMSSPHVAGAGALLKALHPEWGPGQIKSALMTTAAGGSVKEDGVTPTDSFDTGSGRIDLAEAGDPGLVFNVSAADYRAHELDSYTLNYPSAYVPIFGGEATITRYLQTTLTDTAAWHLSVMSDPGVSVEAPAIVTVPEEGVARLDLTVRATGLADGQTARATVYFENQRSGDVRVFPITVVGREPAVSLDKVCFEVPPFAALCTITATNNAFEEAQVHIVDELPYNLLIIEGAVQGATQSGNTVSWSGTLDPAELPAVTVEDATGGTPAGFLPLADFGVAPIEGFTDESIINYTVPAFVYAGETYDTLGIVSNGYLVIGGGDGGDVVSQSQLMPDQSEPNNVVAPLWNDMNPEAAGEIRIVVLEDGPDAWTVIEFNQVPNFTDGELNSFQIWLGANGVQDVTIAYGPEISNGDEGISVGTGAEDAGGQSGAMWWYRAADGTETGTPVVPGTELRVESIPGSPGGTHAISFWAARWAGAGWENCAEMTANVFFGVNVACYASTQ